LPDIGFATEVTYHLTVAEPMVVEPVDVMLEATPTARGRRSIAAPQ